ncbi:MAG: hypothetical protein IJU61_04965 [Victivallales bacterium]|nr:hypothetical protein [Victivallales bacterium]
MSHFFIIIAGLFIINIVHADVTKKDLETLHTFIQEKKPLAEIEASDVWKKLANPTEEDIRAMREFPKVAAEQQPFMTFHNRDMMDIIRYISQEIKACEENGDYDHEIALMDTLYSFYRLHILNAHMQGLMLGSMVYPLIIGTKLTPVQKRRLVDICESKMARIPAEKFCFTSSVFANGREKHRKAYECTFMKTEFIVHVMKSLLSEEERGKIERDFAASMEKMLNYYGLEGVYRGAIFDKPEGNFKFYLITKEPLYFYYADQNKYICDGEPYGKLED